jgi:hypothetical protein
MGSIPPAIDIDGLAIGISLDIFGIADFVWPAAAEGCPEAHPAATSASAPTPTAARKPKPGRKRLETVDLDMDRPPPVPAPADGHRRTRLDDAP